MVVATAVTMMATDAQAQDAMKGMAKSDSAMKKDAMSKSDGMKKDAMSKSDTKKPAMKKDSSQAR